MLSADVLFLKDQNKPNFFFLSTYFPHENTEDVSREVQSFAEFSYIEPADVPNSI